MTRASWGGSFWDGHSRTFLRGGLAVIGASNLFGVATDLAHDQRGPWSHPFAPEWLLSLGGSPLVGVLLAVGLGALWRFARQPGQVRAGVVALLTMALLVEADAALNEGPKRHFFAPGLALLGWIVGLAFARLSAWRAGQHEAVDVQWLEAHAEMGAVAALAGNYVDAVGSKLLHVGAHWANDTTLRSIVLAHHTLGDPSLAGRYAAFVAGNAPVAQALSIATLLVQGGACLMLLGPRWRLIAGLAIFLFHSNVELLTGIGYGPARTLLLLFCLPWPRFMPQLVRWWPRARTLFEPAHPVTKPSLSGTQLAQVGALVVGVVAVVVLFAQVVPIRAYAAMHHSYHGERAGPRPQQ